MANQQKMCQKMLNLSKKILEMSQNSVTKQKSHKNHKNSIREVAEVTDITNNICFDDSLSTVGEKNNHLSRNL